MCRAIQMMIEEAIQETAIRVERENRERLTNKAEERIKKRTVALR